MRAVGTHRVAGASRATRRDAYPRVDRAPETKAHARRRDRPRVHAYATCCRRTRAPAICLGDLLEDVELEIAVGEDLFSRPFSCSNCRCRLMSAGSTAPKCFDRR